MAVTFYTGHFVPYHLTWQSSQKRNRGKPQLLSHAFSPLAVSRSLSDRRYTIHPIHMGGSTVLVIMFNLFPTVSLVFSAELSKCFDLFCCSVYANQVRRTTYKEDDSCNALLNIYDIFFENVNISFYKIIMSSSPMHVVCKLWLFAITRTNTVTTDQMGLIITCKTKF